MYFYVTNERIETSFQRYKTTLFANYVLVNINYQWTYVFGNCAKLIFTLASTSNSGLHLNTSDSSSFKNSRKSISLHGIP